MARGERGLLFGARFLLIALLPFGRRHPVDDLARLVLLELDTLLGRGLAIPIAETISAEACEIHHVDVLHVGSRAQVSHQAAKRRRFEFGSGLLVHLKSS